MFNTINNYQMISSNLHTSAQPSVEEFREIKQAGIEIIINLARIDSPDALTNGAQIIQENGMHYVHIPVDFENPDSSDLELFFSAMERYDNMPMLVHCARNWRVACFIYLYRVIKLNNDIEIAKKELLMVWKPNEIWQSFIDGRLSQQEKTLE